MKYPTTRFVFDRKKTASKTKDALIQVEILLDGKKKYVTTGVRVYKDQWNDRNHVCKRDDMFTLNERIDAIKERIDGYINKLAKNGDAFDWDSFTRYLESKGEAKESFIDYVRRRILERQDIKASTKKAHMKMIGLFLEFGKINRFEDLTKPNIAAFYEWMLGRDIVKIGRDGKEYTTKMQVSTVAGYMKNLRTYIHDAMLFEKIEKDPSVGITVKRKESEQTRWLTKDEVKRIEDAELSNGSLVRVRDLFIFSCYSGLAFSDLMDFRPGKLEREGDETYLYGHRIKTGKEYIVLILPKAQAILEKYDYDLPKYTNQYYNKRLKELAEESGVEQDLSAHWGRITFGFLALNEGVRIEVVSKALGHATISETQRTYSRILKKTVVNEMAIMK